MTKEVITPELVVAQVNAPVLAEDQSAALIATLAPIAARRDEITTLATSYECYGQDDADRAGLALKDIDADLKTVAAVLAAPKQAAHERHKLITTLEKALTEAHGQAKAALKTKVAAWVSEERRKAAEIQAKLQREADERAARERAALEAKAAKMKTEAKREEYEQRAADVQSVTVAVDAPKASGVRLSERWKATVADPAALLAHVAQDPRGFLDDGIIAISETKLAAAKTRFTSLALPGVRFEKVLG